MILIRRSKAMENVRAMEKDKAIPSISNCHCLISPHKDSKE
jgi:hypothetical protein